MKALTHITKFLNARILLYLVVLVSVYNVAHKSDVYYGWTNHFKADKTIFIGDGFGYYGYLPQYVIYPEQKHYTFLDSLGKKDPLIRDQFMIPQSETSHVRENKFFVGTALAMSPFFLTNHAFQKLSNGETDGYSFSYRFAIFCGAMFYLLLGLIGLVKLLKSFAISNLVIICALIGLVFGTNLTYYASIEFTMSHVYAFAFCTWFLVFLKKWVESDRSKDFYMAVFFYSFLILIRPVDGLILLIVPFFFNSFNAFLERTGILVKKPKTILMTFLIFSCFIGIQLLSNNEQFGTFKLNGYSNEGFDYLFSPKFIEVLFGYRKGMFLYSPLLLLIIPGFLVLFFKRQYFGVGSFFVFVVIIWITSSWWCWYYGGGFGMRPLIDFYSFFVLIITLSLQYFPRLIRGILLVFSIAFVYFSQVAEYQYVNNIFHWDQMNKHYYWHLFLKEDSRFIWYPNLQLESESLPKEVPNKKMRISLNGVDKRANGIYAYNSTQKVFHFYPEKQHARKYGFLLEGMALITNPNDIDGVELLCFKNMDTIHRKIEYIGNQLRDINKFEHFQLEFYNSYIQFSDSIQLLIDDHTSTRKLKNATITILMYD